MKSGMSGTKTNLVWLVTVIFLFSHFVWLVPSASICSVLLCYNTVILSSCQSLFLTYQAHEKYLRATMSNFSQAQLSTPWWRIAHDPKHVGV